MDAHTVDRREETHMLSSTTLVSREGEGTATQLILTSYNHFALFHEFHFTPTFPQATNH